MADPAVARWKQAGIIYLWRYTEGVRDFPGWHLAVDRAGGESMLTLFDLMRNARWASRVALDVTVPTPAVLSVPNNRGGDARCKSVERLRLHFDRQFSPDFWRLAVDGGGVTLSLGEGKLGSLRQGISDVLRGEGDYCIGPDDDDARLDQECLWFWWTLDP